MRRLASVLFAILFAAAAWTASAGEAWELSTEAADSIGHLNMEIPYHIIGKIDYSDKTTTESRVRSSALPEH